MCESLNAFSRKVFVLEKDSIELRPTQAKGKSTKQKQVSESTSTNGHVLVSAINSPKYYAPEYLKSKIENTKFKQSIVKPHFDN